MAEATLQIEQLRQRVGQRVGRPDAFDDIVRQALPVLKIMAVSGTRETFKAHTTPDGQPWPALKHSRPDGSSEPLEDSGRLLNSIAGQATAKEIRLVASHPAANVHQYGGVITPRVAKMLAIPITVEAKRAGSPRANFPRPLFVLKGPKAICLAEAGPNGVIVHYVLKRFVRVPKREFLGFSRPTLNRMEKLLADRCEEYLLGPFFNRNP